MEILNDKQVRLIKDMESQRKQLFWLGHRTSTGPIRATTNPFTIKPDRRAMSTSSKYHLGVADRVIITSSDYIL